MENFQNSLVDAPSKSTLYIYSENSYLLNTHVSYDKLLLTRKLLDLRLI